MLRVVMNSQLIRALGLSCAVFGLALSLPSCKKASSGKGAQNQLRVYVAENWDALDVSTLGYIAMGSSVEDPSVENEADRFIEGQLRGSQNRFNILSSKTIASRAEKAGESTLLNRVKQVWKDDSQVDKFLAVKLCGVLGVDGLMFSDLSDWTEERIDATQEGSSWSRAAIGLFIYGGDDGVAIWAADRSRRIDSIPYVPSLSSGESDEQNQRSLNRTDTTPEPPKIEDVAREVMGELIEAFPPRK